MKVPKTLSSKVSTTIDSSNLIIKPEVTNYIVFQINLCCCIERAPINYATGIPAVSETATGRKLETARLREMRKRLDSGNYSQEEIEAMGLECLPDVVELCSGKTFITVHRCENISVTDAHISVRSHW